MVFRDRTEAGRLLGNALTFLKGRNDIMVLAIPRGGVPVGKELAEIIGAPLDIVIARKIGAPWEPELAVGAVTQDGEVVLDEKLIAKLRVPEAYLKQEATTQVEEARLRATRYRWRRPFPRLEGKTVVIVDDGIATGSTIRAAIKTARAKGAVSIILAAPVGPPDTVAELSKTVDRVVCLSVPDCFEAIGECYEEFGKSTTTLSKKFWVPR
jgi:putative phosphoribosyl transferase